MAVRVDDTDNPAITAALGGTVNANDTIRLRKYAKTYTTGAITGNPDLAAAYLDAGFRGSFSAARGGSSAPLTLVVNQAGAGVFVDQSNAEAVDLQSTSGAGVIYDIRYKAANGHLLQLGAMDCDKLRVLRPGTVIAASGADVANAYCGAGTTTFDEGGPALTLLSGGGSGRWGPATINLNRDVTTLNVEGNATVVLNSTTCSPGTINMRGGTLVMGLQGDVTTLQGDGGVIDQTRLTTPITIGTSALGPNVIILRSAQTVEPTVTTNNDYGGGPTIIVV